MDTVKNADLRPGMFLVDGGDQRLGVNDAAEPSSMMPGSVRVETDFGILYLDEDGESQVEVEW